MMASMPNTDMGGAQHSFDEAYEFDRMLIDLKRQLSANTRQYSRAANTQQRVGNAMGICKPGSANNSPRSSGLQAGRTQYTPHRQVPEIRPARPVSWHPSSHHQGLQGQQPLFFHQGSHGVMPPQFPACHDETILASPQYVPSTPGVYSGYASPTESYSPRSPQLYWRQSSQKHWSPPKLRVPTQQQQQQPQALDFRSMPSISNYDTPGMACQLPDQSAPRMPTLEQYRDHPFLPTQQPTAPSSPTYFGSSNGGGLVSPPGIARSSPTNYGSGSLVSPPGIVVPSSLTDYGGGGPISPTGILPMQEDLPRQPTFPAPTGNTPPRRSSLLSQLPRIYYDNTDDSDMEEDSGKGEILYGLGLYDKPGSAYYNRPCQNSATAGKRTGSRVPAGANDVVRRRFGWEKDNGEEEEESGSEIGKGAGLGMKLEEAWTPPASDDEGEEDGEGEEMDEDEEWDGDGEFYEAK